MSDWWSRKLAGEQPTRQSTPPSRPPAPVPVNPSQMPTHRLPVEYNAEEDYVTTKAQHARNAHTCPSCGSGNYMSNPGSSYYRCYDCGYPVVQSTSGLTGGAGEGPVQAAQQVSTQNNYNPGNIVGRLN